MYLYMLMYCMCITNALFSVLQVAVFSVNVLISLVEFTSWSYSGCVVWWVCDRQDWTQAIHHSLQHSLHHWMATDSSDCEVHQQSSIQTSHVQWTFYSGTFRRMDIIVC